MIVTATGSNTTLGRIGKSLTGITEARSPLQLETRTLVNRFTLAPHARAPGRPDIQGAGNRDGPGSIGDALNARAMPDRR
jgi:hypothetical protein